MARYRLVMLTALAGLSLASHGALAFTVINQNNYTQGGSRAMTPDPNTSHGATATQSGSGLALGLNNNSAGLGNGPGYGGYGALDFSNGSTSHDSFPSFPGMDNHLTPGANVGILQYGALPHRY